MPSKTSLHEPAEPWERLNSAGESIDQSNTTSMNSLQPHENINGNYIQLSMADIMENQSYESDESVPWWKRQKGEIVISGVSCRLPESDNMNEFAEHLLNGDDMITEDDRRWQPGLFGLPRRHGKLKNLTKFDATFFGVHPKQANNMDPQLRMLLEVTYEALLDAGINPMKLRGSRTGVFVGCSGSETAAYLTRDAETVTGYSLTGCVRSMFANRLSYFFDFRGPSFAVDTACSSSLLALQLAVDAIRQDECDAALIAGSHLTLTPTTALQFMRLGLLSSQGKCQTYDANGEGYVRSEGIVAIFLQKSTVARRCYATVVHAKSNTDGYKEQGITFPSGERQAELLRNVYREAGIDPSSVAYVETHGTGTKVGDPEEANALCQIYCSGRTGPLLVGSVKSNMGHAEPASGLAAIAKMLIAFQSGFLPPNLNFEVPNPSIPGLLNGQLKVVTTKTPWNGGIVGVNSFGFGGSNTHVVLRSPVLLKQKSRTKPVHSRLFCFAGRVEKAVEKMLNTIEEKDQDDHLLGFLSEVACTPANLYPYRGYIIYNRHNDSPIKHFQKVSYTTTRPVWFIYSGMGSQWPGMGRDMMEFPMFKEAILRCTAALKNHGITDVNPYDIIMKGENVFENHPLNCFVCISSIQIALTDMLREMGIQPNGIIGHSTGEMVAGYCDGCFSVEETILTAYYRGKLMMDAKFPLGGMAAVGMTAEEAESRLIRGVYVACHNAEDSISLSGEFAEVEKLVNELQKEGIFAKMINSSGMAFHTPIIKKIETPLREHLKQVIKNPKLRSSRWISSSVPQSNWDTDLGKFCSADYHVNNTMSTVLFNEALQHVPKNAVVIEIAPHCLLQAVLRRAVDSSCILSGLMKAKHENNVEYFCTAIGKLFETGLVLNPHCLYNQESYPVPLSTPMISPLIEWDHSAEWPVVSTQDLLAGGAGGIASSCSIVVDPFNPETKDQYLLDHVIDGRVLFPFTGHLIYAWRALCKIRGLDMNKTPIVIEDFHVYRATILNRAIKFNITVSHANGNFEILEGDSLAASGRITIVDYERPLFYQKIDEIQPNTECERIKLSSADVYKELLLRGYEYGPSFKCIYESCNSGDRTLVLWSDNWVTFLDSVLQTALLFEKADTLKLPTRLRYLRIDPQKHLKSVIHNENLKLVTSRSDSATKGFSAGGVEVCELIAQTVPRRLNHGEKVHIERVHFTPNYSQNCFINFPDIREKLLKYKPVCLALFRKFLQTQAKAMDRLFDVDIFEMFRLKLTEASDTVASEILDELDDDSFPVGRMLRELTESLSDFQDKDELMEAIATYRENLPHDLFWNGSGHELCLKSFLDAALENNACHSDKICMFEPSDIIFPTLCYDLQRSHPLVQVNWTFVGQNIDSSYANLPAEILELDINAEKVTVPVAHQNKDLVILNRILWSKSDINGYLEKVKLFMRDDGFCLVNEITDHFDLAVTLLTLLNDSVPVGKDNSRIHGLFLDFHSWAEIFTKAGFQIVCSHSDVMMGSLFLLRKKVSIPREPIIINIDDVKEFSWVPELKEALEKHAAEDQTTIWLTSKLHDNGTVGLALCLREEYLKNKIRSLADISLKTKDSETTDSWDLNSEEMKEILNKDMHSNLYRNGTWGTFRYYRIRDEETFRCEPTEHAFITTLVRGDLSSLTWVASPNKYWTQDTNDRRLCYVHYASLNFRDIMLATGRLSVDAIPGTFLDRECLLGMEFSGCLKSGERIMGLLPCQALATTVVADMRFVWKVPESWTLEEAATVPVVYTTAFYALIVRGRMQRGEKVLIHSGSGGVGMAAIAIALSHGCEVFTTVGSEEKKSFLKATFPQLEDRHFSSSRTTDFEFHIMHATSGRGVDLVLNSLAEEKLQASVRCLAQHGRFLEIGKYDLSADSKLGMSLFLKNVAFHGILLDSLFDQNNKEWSEVSRLLVKGIADGIVKPLPASVFPHGKAEDAFRYMAAGKHKGKVLLKIRNEEPAGKITPFLVQAVARSYCCPEHTYVITGGLGGFGLELSNWLISRGAKKIVLTSRSGVKTGYQARYLYFWRRMGISIVVMTHDVSDPAQAAQLINDAQELGPIGGIFHLAMVLRDCMFENQTIKNYQESAKPKYWGTRNLDAQSRKLCGPSLKWYAFVVFSSMSCARGNAGQTNYGWANSTMERMINQRIADNLPGIAIQWGAIGDVGIVQEKIGNNSTVVGGTYPQRIPSCLQCLDCFLSWRQGIFSSFIRAEIGGKNKSEKSGDAMQAIAHILGISDLKQVDPDSSLGDLGLDSLMGVEIKQTLERDYDVVLSMKDIRTLTLNKLVEITSNATSPGKERSVSVEMSAEQNLMMFRLNIDLNSLRPEKTVIKINSVEEGRPVFLVHPIEGVASSLEMLASKLPFPVYCLQCTPEAPLDSMETLALYYSEQIRTVCPDPPYRIVGYSFGALIAFEMANLIQEKNPDNPNAVLPLILLDSSHRYMTMYRKAYRMAYGVDSSSLMNDPRFESELLCAFCYRFSQADYKLLRHQLITLPSWEERVSLVTEKIMEGGLFKDPEIVSFALNSLRQKFLAADRYSPTRTFRGDVTLVRSEDTIVRSEDIGNYYGLQEVVTGKVLLHIVEGDHYSFIHETGVDKTAAIITETIKATE
ncbi:Fatty acid synthase [Trichinella murrelli]|uniref:Fatty acid synthase n=1 Tax=Trichinella murrelli TaxID=144512 RepID=A0A0V0TMM3_9BILA|nr:Fatty acid synthase [Trichinella murrelli]